MKKGAKKTTKTLPRFYVTRSSKRILAALPEIEANTMRNQRMKLKQAFERAKKLFGLLGTVFVDEQLAWYDGDEGHNGRNICVSVVFNERCRKIVGENCSQGGSSVSFEDAITKLEALLKPHSLNKQEKP